MRFCWCPAGGAEKDDVKGVANKAFSLNRLGFVYLTKESTRFFLCSHLFAQLFVLALILIFILLTLY